MARRSAQRSATTSRSIVLRPVQTSGPRPIVVRTTKTIKAKPKRRGGRVGGKSERHRLYTLMGAAALGWMDKSDSMANIPTLPFLGKAGTVGVACYFGGKWMKSPMLDDAATGILSIAVYELAKQGHIDGDEVEGHRRHRSHGDQGFEGGI